MTEDKNQNAEVNQSFEDDDQSGANPEAQPGEANASAEPAQVENQEANEAPEPVGGEDKGVENPDPADPDAEQHGE
jgi:hypothetical protein